MQIAYRKTLILNVSSEIPRQISNWVAGVLERRRGVRELKELRPNHLKDIGAISSDIAALEANISREAVEEFRLRTTQRAGNW